MTRSGIPDVCSSAHISENISNQSDALRRNVLRRLMSDSRAGAYKSDFAHFNSENEALVTTLNSRARHLASPGKLARNQRQRETANTPKISTKKFESKHVENKGGFWDPTPGSGSIVTKFKDFNDLITSGDVRWTA